MTPETDPANRTPELGAWWLTTRRRRAEWQALKAAALSHFEGRPRHHFERARIGDPVLLYLSKPDHQLRAVGVVISTGEDSGKAGIDVQLAFELPNPLTWKEVAGLPALKNADPVRGRSSGALLPLLPDEYEALKGLVLQNNPEVAAQFSAVDSGVAHPIARTPSGESKSRRVGERSQRYDAKDKKDIVTGKNPEMSTLSDLHDLTGLSLEVLEEARDLLEDTGQIVLSGPPGTGKTWLARGLATLAAGSPARVQLVQFHPSTTYEDFVEGLKPLVDTHGAVSYAVVPGTFVRFCDRARLDPECHYVLVIDEINRAPLSRVFGELLYALEYRGIEGAVALSASSGPGSRSDLFFVPENVLIIGTMNTADRSLALVDYALRRRFRFVEVEPDEQILGSWHRARGAAPEKTSVLLDLFREVNTRISASLDPDHRLGHSYFMIEPLNGFTLGRLWRTAIRPLISEYYIPPGGEVEEFDALFAEASSELEAGE